MKIESSIKESVVEIVRPVNRRFFTVFSMFNQHLIVLLLQHYFIIALQSLVSFQLIVLLIVWLRSDFVTLFGIRCHPGLILLRIGVACYKPVVG